MKEMAGCPGWYSWAGYAVIPARKQALGQGTVCNDDAALRLGEWQQILLCRAGDEAIRDLIAQYPAAQRGFGRAPSAE